MKNISNWVADRQTAVEVHRIETSEFSVNNIGIGRFSVYFWNENGQKLRSESTWGQTRSFKKRTSMWVECHSNKIITQGNKKCIIALNDNNNSRRKKANFDEKKKNITSLFSFLFFFPLLAFVRFSVIRCVTNAACSLENMNDERTVWISFLDEPF